MASDGYCRGYVSFAHFLLYLLSSYVHNILVNCIGGLITNSVVRSNDIKCVEGKSVEMLFRFYRF